MKVSPVTRVSVWLVVLSLFGSLTASAADRSYDRYRKRRVQAGLQEALGRPARAAEALTEAYAAYPDERVLLEAILLFERGGDSESAVRTAERYLSIARSPEGREEAKRLLSTVRASLSETRAEIAFTSDPDGAEVCSPALGSPLCRVAPFVLWVPAGQHVLQVRSSGLDARAIPLEVAAGKHQDVVLTLRARVAVGRLDVFSPVDGAPVTIDGEAAGKTPLADLRLPAGAHRVEVALPGSVTWTAVVDVAAGDTTTLYAGQAPTRTGGSPGSGLVIPPAPPQLVATTRVLTVPKSKGQLPEPGLAGMTPTPSAGRNIGASVAVAPERGDRPDPADQPRPDRPDFDPEGNIGMPPTVSSDGPDLPSMDPTLDPEPYPDEPDRPDPEPPVADPVPPVADPEPPVADPEPPVADPEPPVADPEPPVADPEPPVADPELPVADPEPPVADPELPALDPDGQPVVAAVDPDVANPDPETPPETDPEPDPETPPETDPEPDPEPQPEIGVTETVSAPISWRAPTGWTAVGLGVGALAGAIATQVLAGQSVADANALDPNLSDYDARVAALGDEAQGHVLTSNILYPVSAALAAAGIGLLIWDWLAPSDDDTSAIDPNFGLSPTSGGVLLQTTLSF